MSVPKIVIILILLFALLIPSWASASKTFTQITFNPARDYYPSWSPDGTKIVFCSDRSGNGDIWVIDFK